MKCPDKGIIQAFIDCELDIELKKEIENHISSCTKCSESLKELKENDDFVFGKLKGYKKFIEDNTASFSKPIVPGSSNHTGFIEKKGVSMFMSKYKKVIAAACAVIVIAACITFQPLRSAIASTLSIFRVENIKGITVSLHDLQEIQQKLQSNQPEINMDKMGKIKTSGGQRKAESLKELQGFSDFKVLLPEALSSQTPQVDVVAPATIDFTLNAGNVNQVLKSFGAQKLLPESIDGKTFSVDFASQINLNYSSGNSSFNIIQTKSPVIKVPDGVNVDEIYNSLVELPILPSDLQEKLKSIKDWKNTLYIPVTDSMEEVDINGSKGFIQVSGSRENNSLYTAIIWYNNGVITTVSGNLGRNEILGIARSMR